MKKVLALLLALAMMLGMTSFASAEEITIEFWTVFTGDDGATLQSLINKFNDEHAGTIKVNHTAIAAADLYTKLPLAVQTGEGIPDLMIGHVERLPKLVGDGVLTDVEYLLENGVDAANYPANVLERTNIEGYQYGIPWDFNAGVLYVNLDLLAKYGMEDVLTDKYITFDEIKAIGEAIKTAGDAETVKAVNYYGSLNGYLPRYEELGGVLVNEAGQVPLYKAVTEMAEFQALPQTFLAEAFMSDHIHVYTYYYWALLDSAIGHAGKTAIYDATIDVNTVGAAIQAEVDDAIAASK